MGKSAIMTSVDLERFPPVGGVSAAVYLGNVIKVRRNQLGLTRADVTAAGGPTHQTVYELEFGKKAKVNRRTLRALERALGFEPDTLVERAVYGEPPVTLRPEQPIAESPQPEAVEHTPTTEPTDDQRANQEVMHRLMKMMGRRYGTAWVLNEAARVAEELDADAGANNHSH